jgi:hypothetical protein
MKPRFLTALVASFALLASPAVAAADGPEAGAPCEAACEADWKQLEEAELAEPAATEAQIEQMEAEDKAEEERTGSEPELEAEVLERLTPKQLQEVEETGVYLPSTSSAVAVLPVLPPQATPSGQHAMPTHPRVLRCAKQHRKHRCRAVRKHHGKHRGPEQRPAPQTARSDAPGP